MIKLINLIINYFARKKHYLKNSNYENKSKFKERKQGICFLVFVQISFFNVNLRIIFQINFFIFFSFETKEFNQYNMNLLIFYLKMQILNL